MELGSDGWASVPGESRCSISRHGANLAIRIDPADPMVARVRDIQITYLVPCQAFRKPQTRIPGWDPIPCIALPAIAGDRDQGFSYKSSHGVRAALREEHDTRGIDPDP
jgi:hypothetical protein